jgi:hypothetical protein
MSDIDAELGPVDYLVVAFPASKADFSGEMASELRALMDGGTVRVLDLVLLSKDMGGSVEAAELRDADDSEVGQLRAAPAHPFRGDGRVVRRAPRCGNVGSVPTLQPGSRQERSARRGKEREVGAERERIAQFGRLEDGLHQQGTEWYRWGPYVSERQWGTVREDYSADGNAWDYLPHDHARSRAYRWGEDGLAGFCDIGQRLCLGLALWNGRDPILKERAFGLTGPQGNHGEDVKEYWWYLDAVPSHAWNRWRYHYPQGPFPYQDLIDTNRARDRRQPEYELLDTGAFDDDRYWITEVRYAKAGPDDLLMAIQVTNAGPEPDTLHVLPTAWFRNTWSWGGDEPRSALRTREPGRCQYGKRREARHGTRTHKRPGSPPFCAYRNFGAHRAGDFGEREMR